MRKLVAILVLLVFATSLSGEITVTGVGKAGDVKKAREGAYADAKASAHSLAQICGLKAPIGAPKAVAERVIRSHTPFDLLIRRGDNPSDPWKIVGLPKTMPSNDDEVVVELTITFEAP